MEASSVVFINSIVPYALDDTNYKGWSSCMEDYLLSQDLWDVIEDDEPEPAQETGKSSSDSSNNITKSGWRKKNASALHAIKMSCGPKILSKVVEVKSAKMAWDLLAATAIASESTDSEIEIEDDSGTLVHNVLDDIEGIVEDQQANDLDREAEERRRRNILDCFIKGTQEWDWKRMEKNIDCYPQALSATVFHNDRTALHYALSEDRLEIAELLVNRVKASDLEIVDGNGLTPLAYAAGQHRYGRFWLLELMIKKNSNLANIGETNIPVLIASRRGFRSMIRFLYHVTDKSILTSSEAGVQLLINCINLKMFDVASDLVINAPKILLDKNNADDIYPIKAFAMAFSALPTASTSGQKKSSQFNRWLSNMRKYIMGYVHDDKVEKLNEQSIYDQALVFLRLVCDQVQTFDTDTLREVAYDAMIEAAINGNIEFITGMLEANSSLIFAEKGNRNLISHAVENRQEKVFNLIYGIPEKDLFLSRLDKQKNNILHYAAMIPHLSALNRISASPILQLLREVMWFKEVLNLTRFQDREIVNKNGLKPRQLFDKSHKELIKAGEILMRDTARSCTVVGALIVTIMFAATFTVPGGNNQNTGYPLFVDKVLFKIFITSDALSLYSSTTSILVFLEILTSRYAKEDLLLYLPRKIMVGLLALFFSIATMMVTFCSALAIMLAHRLEFILPISLVACLPVFLFLSSIFSVFSQIVKSTFSPSIFDKNTKLPIEKRHEKVHVCVEEDLMGFM